MKVASNGALIALVLTAWGISLIYDESDKSVFL